MPDTARRLRQPYRRRWSVRWRVVLAAAAAMSFTACTAGCTSTALTSATARATPSASLQIGSVPLVTAPAKGRTFTGSGLSFAYDRSWTAKHWTLVSTMTYSVVYLSSQMPGGVLIDWYLANFPRSRLDAQPGAVAHFGGHPPWPLIGSDDRCRELGGHTSVDAAMSYGSADPGGQEIHVATCLGSPAGVPAVLSMLRSVRLSGLLR